MSQVTPRRPRWIAACAVVLAVALTFTACSSAPHPGSSSAVGSSATDPPEIYVALGDSYAAGLQATGVNSGMTTTNGFAYQIAEQARAVGRDIQLVNFGCVGATTESVLHGTGCAREGLGPAAQSYDGTSQSSAAIDFISTHSSRIALVTISLGGNDLLSCPLADGAQRCFGAASDRAGVNLTTLLAGVRAAAGPAVPIVGTTYPDVFLGAYLSGDATSRQLARASPRIFADLFNPRLEQAYSAAGAAFADVTMQSGGYGPFDTERIVPPYGLIPEPVARLCELTSVCQLHDVHPTTAGYGLIADAVLAQLGS